MSRELNQQLIGQSQQHIHWLTSNMGIHEQMLDAWQQMVTAAQKDNIELSIASGFRSFERQLTIWNRKFSNEVSILDINEKPIETSELSELALIEAIMLFSALPGASRHHWGTDIDVYAPNLLPKDYTLKLEKSEYSEQGPLAALHQWLEENAKTFEFSFPYKHYQGGVASEPWHLSYQPLALHYEQNYQVDLLSKTLELAEIKGKQTLLDNIEMLYNRFIRSTFNV